jgi:hypothetical protein
MRDHDWFDDFMIMKMMEEDEETRDSSCASNSSDGSWLIAIIAVFVLLFFI